jgi:hypothetical protein
LMTDIPLQNVGALLELFAELKEGK